MFGMEIETRIPVVVPGGYDYADLMLSERFRVVLDYRHGIGPVLEFVMCPFDEHTNLEYAVVEFGRRFDAMAGLAHLCAEAEAGTSFKKLAGRAMSEFKIGQYSFTEVGEKAAIGSVDVALVRADDDTLGIYNAGGTPAGRLDPVVRWKLHGPIHYTAGFALRTIPDLIRERLSGSDIKDSSRRRAAEAARLAANLLATETKTHGVNMQAMAGYLALVYMQLGAVEDGKRADKLIKNHTQALCRVPLKRIFRDLADNEQTWLWFSGDEHVGNMKPQLVPAQEDWDPLSRELLVHAFSTNLNYLDDPQDVFGKMTVVKQSEPVGPRESPEMGYALELRRLQAGHGDLAVVRAQSEDLLRYVQRLHSPVAGTMSTRSAEAEDVKITATGGQDARGTRPRAKSGR